MTINKHRYEKGPVQRARLLVKRKRREELRKMRARTTSYSLVSQTLLTRIEQLIEQVLLGAAIGACCGRPPIALTGPASATLGGVFYPPGAVTYLKSCLRVSESSPPARPHDACVSLCIISRQI